MKYIIVGGVAAGASTATRLRRLDEHATIILFEKGPHISFANCGLPYYIGNTIEQRDKLFMQTPDGFRERYRVDLRMQTEVISIDPKNKKVVAREVSNGTEQVEPYDKLVLAPGAEPVRPPLEGLDLQGIFTLRTVLDSDRIRAYIRDNQVKKALVVGAGFIGLEMVENLHQLGIEITLVEMTDQVLAPLDFPIAAIAQEYLKSKGVHLELGRSVQKFSKYSQGLRAHLDSGEELETDLVILGVGVRPDIRLAQQAGLRIGPSKGIWVNEFLQTSDPDIYALGDAIEFKHPLADFSAPSFLAGPANKQGRICANNLALGNRYPYRGSINTAIVKIFDLVIGTTGLSAKAMKRMERPYWVSTNHGASHAGYYPGALPLTIQIVFDPQSGQIMGAQMAGQEGVDKRLDVASVLIQQGKTVQEMAEFEQAYAPPFSSAKDPLNMAGMVADNILSGRLQVFYWEELESLLPGSTLIDVRTPPEFQNGNIPGAINLPLPELRLRMKELPKAKKILIYCEAGLRGYLAQRILRQKGFEDVWNLSGGYKTWEVCVRQKKS